MIKREIAEKLKNVAEKFQVTAVFGPRQVGKTTLVKSVFDNYTYKNLEDPSEREFAENDPKSFLKSAIKGLIIDEVQRVPNIFSHIQVFVDSNREAKIILTGSQNYLLLEKVTQSLSGRIFILQLSPFSMKELRFTESFNDPLVFIFNGFFPPIYDRRISVTDWMPNYIQTYLERDLRQIKNITDLSSFLKFLKLSAGRTGQILNISSIASDAGISVNTAKAWFSILETGYLINFLRPYYKNFNKRLIKSPKLYFVDTGLSSSILDIKYKEQLETHYLRGALFENLILNEIFKYFLNKGERPQLFYWRDNHGNEIDCIFELNGQIIALEFKAGQTISKDYFKGLNYFEKIVNGEKLIKYVVYGGNERQDRKDGIALPWFDWEQIFSE
ncbi:MAG: ATP-binding protein [Bacteroidetes bacterium]|nr:ATP-binding protein [Bacteroidota bacterium]